jgi:hypothetical protein
MEQSPSSHSAGTSSSAEGIFFSAEGIFIWLRFQPPTNFVGFEFKQGLLMKPVVIERGIIAGLVATAALSAIMLMKQSVGWVPELDPIAVIAGMAGASSLLVGWIDHFVIGTVFWEVGFAIVSTYLPAPPRLRGPIFASRIAEELDRSDGNSALVCLWEVSARWHRPRLSCCMLCVWCRTRRGLRIAKRQTNDAYVEIE